MLYANGHVSTFLNSFSCATMHGAYLRRACTCLIPLRTFLQHRKITHHPGFCFREGGRVFGSAENPATPHHGRSITTTFAVQTSPSTILLGNGDYDADQIQVRVPFWRQVPGKCDCRVFICISLTPLEALNKITMWAYYKMSLAGVGRLGSRQKAAWHVYWKHWSARASSPGTAI